MNIVMLMMAGSGVRFGADIPKQFVEVEGQPIFSYILDGYNRSKMIDRIVIVTHKNWIEYVKEWKEKLGADKLAVVTAGGSCRSESVKNGLLAMKDFASEEDVILIHDATHPYVDEKGNEQIIEAVKEYGGATLGQRQYDTVYQMNAQTHMLEKVVPREQIVSGASPEAFRYGDLYRIYTGASKEELDSMTSAGAIALHYGIPMKVIGANVINLKITYKNDMDTFRGMFRSYFPGSYKGDR
jgi:2-C-methyl-D-erythritol 4-phosphate cytidylyltransferase